MNYTTNLPVLPPYLNWHTTYDTEYLYTIHPMFMIFTQSTR